MKTSRNLVKWFCVTSRIILLYTRVGLHLWAGVIHRQNYDLCGLFWLLAYSGSPSLHSLPQLSGSPVLRGHASWCVNPDGGGLSSSSVTRPVRPDMGQLQAQLQQRLNQQRVRSERNTSDWRPASDCGSTPIDTQNIVPTPAQFSRYSAPPAADKVTAVFIPSSLQHATAALPSSSSSSSAIVKPGQLLPAAAARPQSGVSAKSGAGSGCTPAMMSVTVTLGHCSPTSQRVRSATVHTLQEFCCYTEGISVLLLLLYVRVVYTVSQKWHCFGLL